jgi:hypothetical protein
MARKTNRSTTNFKVGARISIPATDESPTLTIESVDLAGAVKRAETQLRREYGRYAKVDIVELTTE